VSRRRNRHTPSRARREPKRPRDVFVRRPFEGLADEPEWVALREIVPAATAPLTLNPSMVERYGQRRAALATLLPLAEPVTSRPDGRVLVALQRDGQSGDVNRDIATALLAGLAAEPGTPVDVPTADPDSPRLADVIEDGPLDITVHERFDYWLDDGADADPAVAASLERANASVYPTARMSAARAAYWCQVPERAHLRWVLAEPEEQALPALARVSAAGGMKLDEQTRFAGMFRAHGLLVPVWDLPREAPAGQWEEPLAAFAKRYAEALAVTDDLTSEERRARQGLIGRQLTLR
jgi:hypothetical protein